MDKKPIIGDRLRFLVVESGLEHNEVASAIGIKISTFSSYVNYTREPSVATLMRIAHYFDVTIDYLTGYSDIRDPYLCHMPDDLQLFLHEPMNKAYIEILKEFTEKLQSIRPKRENPQEHGKKGGKKKKGMNPPEKLTIYD